MSLTNTASRVGPFTTSTLPQALAVTFPFQSSADLKVYNLGTVATPIVPAALLTLNSDYTVTGGGYDASNNMQTGTVTVQAGGANSLVSGDIIVVLRQPAQNQLTSFLSTGLLTVAMIEQALDKQATLIEDLQTQVGAALRIPATDTPVSVMLSTARANKILGFDSSGNIEYVDLVAFEAFMTTKEAAAAASAAASAASAAASAASAAASAASAYAADVAAEDTASRVLNVSGIMNLGETSLTALIGNISPVGSENTSLTLTLNLA